MSREIREIENPRWIPRWSHLLPGAIVIVAGVLFLLHNFNIPLPFTRLHNWWAFFILIAAIGPLTHAVGVWRNRGEFDAEVLHSLMASAVIVTVALAFLTSVSWRLWWPLFLILGGLWVIFKRSARHPDDKSAASGTE